MAEDFTPEETERRRAAVERLRSLRIPLPLGYKFDREEANSRAWTERMFDDVESLVNESESTPDSHK